MSTSVDFTVTISAGAHAEHVGVMTCDTVQHHQIEPQKFSYDKVTGHIKCTDPKCHNEYCITTGKDDEPTSRTPAIEMATCSKFPNGPAADVQKWSVNSAGQISQTDSNGKRCLDVVGGDKMLDLYSCHAAGSAGNQAFEFDAATNHIIQKGTGLCLYVRKD
jgi:hypothetical protein